MMMIMMMFVIMMMIVMMMILRVNGNDVDDHKDYDDDIGAQVSEYDDYEYELKKEGVSEERTDGAYISVKYIPPICHLYHLWDLWTKILRKLSRC